MDTFYVLALFLCIAIASIVGFVIGEIERRRRLKSVGKAITIKAAYEISSNITPSEFGYLLDGTFSRKELAAEIIWLAMHDKLQLSRTGNRLVAKKKFDSGLQLADTQSELMKSLALNGTVPTSSRRQLKRATHQSLLRKGWIADIKSEERGVFSALPKKFVLIVGTVTVLTLVAVTVLGYIITSDAGASLAIGGSVGLLVCIIGILSAIAYIIVINYRKAAGVKRTTASVEHMAQILGLYEYLKTSGLDTMTPDYETIDIAGLDRLYPYAVAAGLDKRILSMF